MTTYIHWQAHLPHPDLRSDAGSRKGSKGSDSVSLLADEEVGTIILRGDADAGRAGKCLFPEYEKAGVLLSKPVLEAIEQDLS